MKRLIVCCDGTWNSEERDRAPTNVWRLYRQLVPRDAQGIEQRTFYQPGVGTDPSRNWLRRKIRQYGGGAFGWGLDANIVEAYRWLIREYGPGDEFWVFGFSRGAYTARSLVGLLRNCGLLRREHEDMMDRAIKLYRARDPDSHPDAPQSDSFRANYSHEIPEIKFLGVCDTVGALGIPGVLGVAARIWNRRYTFHDLQLSTRVQNACHAVAIDERRPAFRPTMWEHETLEERENVEQVWFIGVHADVGGGYNEAELSNFPLRWLMLRAHCCGLALNPPPAKGWEAVATGMLHDSRWLIHKLPWVCRSRPIEAGHRQFIHPSAFERMKADEKYRPRNVPDGYRRYPLHAQTEVGSDDHHRDGQRASEPVAAGR